MKIHSNLVFTVACVLLLCSLSYGQWTRFHGNAYNTGVYPGGQGRSGSLEELWSHPVKEVFFASPALGDVDNDGILEVVCGSIDTLYALNGEDGTVLWKYSTGENCPPCGSAAMGDLNGDNIPEVAFATIDSLRILSGDSGNLLWKHPISGHVSHNPCMADLNGNGSLEVVLSDTSQTCAYDGATGSVLWTVAGYVSFATGSTIAEDTNQDGSAEVMALTNSPSPAFCLLDGSNGALLWSTPVSCSYAKTPAPAFADLNLDGFPEIITCYGDNDVHVLNPVNGSVIWSAEISGATWLSSPCIADIDGNDTLEVIVATVYTRKLTAFSSSGDVLWQSTISPGFPFGTPAVEDIDGDGALEIVVSTQSSVYSALRIFDAETGEEEYHLEYDYFVYSSPAVGDVDNDNYLDVIFAMDYKGICALSTTGQGISQEEGDGMLSLCVSPAPFTSQLSITFELSQADFTSVEVFDLSGRSISLVAESPYSAGTHTLQWNGIDRNGSPVSPGVYLCRVQSGEFVQTTGICLLR